MNTKCPKCSYTRKPNEAAPDYECPQCGVVYSKYRQHALGTTAQDDERETTEKVDLAGSAADTPIMPTARSGRGKVVAAAFIGIVAATLFLSVAVRIPGKKEQAAPEIPAAQDFAYDIRGKYKGYGNRIVNGNHMMYEMDLLIGEDYRVRQAAWTHNYTPAHKSTVVWNGSSDFSYSDHWKRFGGKWGPVDVSTAEFEFKDNHLTVSARGYEHTNVELFDFHYNYDPQKRANHHPGNGMFKKDPGQPGLFCSLHATLPAIRNASVSKEDLDIVIKENCRNSLIETAAKDSLDPTLAQARMLSSIFTVTRYELKNGRLDIHVPIVPFSCGVVMISPYAVWAKTSPVIEESAGTGYTLNTEAVDWEIEVHFLENGEKYALNKEVILDYHHPETGGKQYLRLDLEKIE